jgi:hypothetical protein
MNVIFGLFLFFFASVRAVFFLPCIDCLPTDTTCKLKCFQNDESWESADHVADTRNINLLGNSVYAPTSNLQSPDQIELPPIFQSVPSNCIRAQVPSTSFSNDVSFYNDSSAILQGFGLDTNLELKYQNKFMLQATVSVNAHLYSHDIDNTRGYSSSLTAFKESFSIDPRCFHDGSLKIDDNLLQEFFKLPLAPSDHDGYEMYKSFFKTYGTHILAGVITGAKVTQWATSKSSYNFSESNMKAASCLAFEGIEPWGNGAVSIDECQTITKDERINVSHLNIQTHRQVFAPGEVARLFEGSDMQALQKSSEILIDSAQHNPWPIEYRYLSLHDVLAALIEVKNPEILIRLTTLRSVLDGYMVFGCAFGMQDTKIYGLFWRDYYSLKSGNVEYSCMRLQDGCHDNNDCHYALGKGCQCYGNSCLESDSDRRAVVRFNRNNGDRDNIDYTCRYNYLVSECHCKQKPRWINLWNSKIEG